jgi:Flp pilus assembly protein TadD
MAKSGESCGVGCAFVGATSRKFNLAGCLMTAVFMFGQFASAGDLKITLPKRSHLTPVQRLNREGVESVRKHSYAKAEASFYKAYLLDPDDPFTLNNLGYVAELQGAIERAQRFYALAAQGSTDAQVVLASSDAFKSKTVNHSAANIAIAQNASLNASQNASLGVNHSNVEAVQLLSQGKASEVDLLLQDTLKHDPRNAFTLNNLGVAKEMEGESQDALKYYDAAAALHSDAAALVTMNHSWQGKPVGEMAAQNAKTLRKRLSQHQSTEVKVAELNLRGVSAVNRNDLKSAQQDFSSAYELDPQNAFALNNIGYLAELGGDRETAEYFYNRAKATAKPKVTVGLASRRSAEGAKLSKLAAESDSKVEAKVAADRGVRREKGEPIQLRRRDNSLVTEPTVTEPTISVEPGSQPAQNSPDR